MKTICRLLLPLMACMFTSAANAAWNYHLTVTNIDVQASGKVFVNFDRTINPACTDQSWVVFQSSTLGDKIVDRLLTLIVSAYVSGKYVGVETTGNCVNTTAEANRVQFTDYGS